MFVLSWFMLPLEANVINRRGELFHEVYLIYLDWRIDKAFTIYFVYLQLLLFNNTRTSPLIYTFLVNLSISECLGRDGNQLNWSTTAEVFLSKDWRPDVKEKRAELLEDFSSGQLTRNCTKNVIDIMHCRNKF